MSLEELKPGLRIEGIIPSEVLTVVAVQWHGADALELTYKSTAGALGQQVVFRKDEGKLSIAQSGSRACVPLGPGVGGIRRRGRSRRPRGRWR